MRCEDVALYFTYRHYQENIPLSKYKLMTLVYVAFGHFYHGWKKYLFPEQFYCYGTIKKWQLTKKFPFFRIKEIGGTPRIKSLLVAMADSCQYNVLESIHDSKWNLERCNAAIQRTKELDAKFLNGIFELYKDCSDPRISYILLHELKYKFIDAEKYHNKPYPIDLIYRHFDKYHLYSRNFHENRSSNPAP